MSHDRGSANSPEGVAADALAPGARSERLWTPWRMRYVAGGAREDGCIFCSRLAEDDDVRTLILHRGNRAFVIMNLFPYNTGHLMIVPNAHIASPEEADGATTIEMASLRLPVLGALRRALSPAGFNFGLNVGDVAGAGVADHLHEHVVPRWSGDANFMPIVAATMVMPELIPATYAKIRAELQRTAHPEEPVVNVVLAQDGDSVIADETCRLPRVLPDASEPVWRTALRDARDRGAMDVELITWSGDSRAGEGPTALLHKASLSEKTSSSGSSRILRIAELADADRARASAARQRLSGAR